MLILNKRQAILYKKRQQLLPFLFLLTFANIFFCRSVKKD